MAGVRSALYGNACSAGKIEGCRAREFYPIKRKREKKKDLGVPSFNNFIKYAVMRECMAVKDRYLSLKLDATEQRTRKLFAIMAKRKTRILRKMAGLGDDTHPLVERGAVFVECIALPEGERETFDPTANALLTARFIEFERYSRYINLAHRSSDEGRKRFFLYMVNLHKAELLFLEKLLRRTGECSPRYV
jgi:hypothetical protein